MTLAVGKAAYPDYPQQPGQQPPPPQVVVPLGVGGPLGGYLQQAPPYEQHHHHVLHHPHPLAVGAVGTPPPSSPSAAAANAANNCCCPTSSSSSSSPSSGSSAASSRRGSRSSRSSRSGDEGGGGDGSVAWYCCCCCASSPRSARRRRSVLASVGVCVLVLVYTLLGALAFTALEGSGFRGGPSPPVSRASATGGVGGSTPAHDELRIKTVEKLWSITEDLNILYKDNWTRLAAQEVLRFQDMLVENIKSGAVLNSAPTAAPAGKDGKDAATVAKATSVTTAASTYQAGPHASHRWTFPSSFLYSLTLITTIGRFDKSHFRGSAGLALQGGAGWDPLLTRSQSSPRSRPRPPHPTPPNPTPLHPTPPNPTLPRPDLTHEMKFARRARQQPSPDEGPAPPRPPQS